MILLWRIIDINPPMMLIIPFRSVFVFDLKCDRGLPCYYNIAELQRRSLNGEIESLLSYAQNFLHSVGATNSRLCVGITDKAQHTASQSTEAFRLSLQHFGRIPHATCGTILSALHRGVRRKQLQGGWVLPSRHLRISLHPPGAEGGTAADFVSETPPDSEFSCQDFLQGDDTDHWWPWDYPADRDEVSTRCSSIWGDMGFLLPES